ADPGVCAAFPFYRARTIKFRRRNRSAAHRAPPGANSASAARCACSFAGSVVFIVLLMVLSKIAPGVGALGVFRSGGEGIHPQRRRKWRLKSGSLSIQ